MSDAEPVGAQAKIAVIACGVLDWNLKRVMARIEDTEFTTRILPAQLHANPRRLRQMLQEEIDGLSSTPGLKGIVLGFGVCGRGTLGLTSGAVPLVVPKVQDCIGIYLGSHHRYLSEFRRRPGTRYMTQGWYEKTVKDRPGRSYMTARDNSLYGPGYGELEERYGADNARFICEFRETWKRNYQRSCYIRFSEEQSRPPGQQVTEGVARSLDWEHEVLEGDETLLYAMLNGDWHDPRILLVPPHSKTVPAPGAAVLAFTTGFESKADEILAKYRDGAGESAVQRSGIGLGIDTGGTYTDAVLFDFGSERVVGFSKAPTTHEDLVLGIRQALSELPAGSLGRVERVGLSTTLATNAFVERKGRPVALLLMTPVDAPLDDLPFHYVRRIRGVMSIEGDEVEPLDPDEVRAVAAEALAAGCQAFAVSGFGSVVNPAHEKEVSRLALTETGLHAVCGHELSTRLNFVERATTAAMNAKLVPLIETLLDAVDGVLREFGLGHVRTMVVKGDGSQMLSRVARDVPVETVLSGPAASVVGAARLFNRRNAVVADMGGTTFDVAVLRDGSPILSDQGARIGDFRTSVRAMSVQTIGLGGDSEVDLSGWPEVRIGPRRVVPLCRVGERFPQVNGALQTLDLDRVSPAPNCLDFVALAPGAEPVGRLLEHLGDGPRLLDDLAGCMDRPGARHIAWEQTETEGKIWRYGLTLTDVLHAEGSFVAFDPYPATRVLECWSALLDVDRQDLIDAIHHEFRRLAAGEILGALLPASCPWEEGDALRNWMTAHLALTGPRGACPVGGDVRFQTRVNVPLIPVGAPTPTLFPGLRPVLNQEILVSEYAAVANALGAIAGDVLLQEHARVRVTEDGALLCSWRGGNARAPNLTAALGLCERALLELIRREAEANQIVYSTPVLSAQQHQADTREGKVFFGVSLFAELRG